jgi:hypothetical protein
VWTGSEMIIWGGHDGSGDLTKGVRYNPATGAWLFIVWLTEPAARHSHTAVWTGSEMIVWGGVSGGGYFYDGGRYNRAVDSWTAMTTTGGPAERAFHTAVWTGSEMIVWGGYNGGYLNDTFSYTLGRVMYLYQRP